MQSMPGRGGWLELVTLCWLVGGFELAVEKSASVPDHNVNLLV